ncbi:MAG: helix-turn-helix transcriptional regulator [Acidobacteria bacterium]|nr:helix-turn-helix transcriptional regulator [Acidobacteriota bacterium]
MIGLSESQLYLAFKAETGMTTTQCVRKVRLAHAGKLLTTTFLHITEVAHQSDYTDVYHFSREFKRVHQLCPKEFRRKNDKNNLP